MPTRKIKKSYRNVTGVLASQKNNRMIASESTLERDFYNLLEFDPMVETFEEQPITLPYKRLDEKSSRYTPDVIIHLNESPSFIWSYSPFRPFYVNYRSCVFQNPKNIFIKPKFKFISPKSILVEVKYRNDLFNLWKELKPKFKAARLYAQERNWQFRVITEKEIRTQLLKNIKFIRPFKRYEFSIDDIMMVIKNLADFGECQTIQLLEKLNKDKWEQGRFIPVIWHLVSKHEIQVDWNKPITLHSNLISTI